MANDSRSDKSDEAPGVGITLTNPKRRANPTSLLAAACRLVLKPIIGILLRGGMPYAVFSAIAKSVYVEVASEDFGIGGRLTNRSRIAMLTGLSRTQVRQELDTDTGSDGDDPADKVRHVSRVLLGWRKDPDFVDANGTPRLLDEDDGDAGFVALYERYSGKVVPSATRTRTEYGAFFAGTQRAQVDDGAIRTAYLT